MKTIIFDSSSYHDTAPAGFNAVKVKIDGGLKSDLLWKEAKEAAWRYIEEGFKIFWELDLGILSGLRHPLTHTSQFMSLKLSVAHFRDTFWKEFGDSTVGISLFRGGVDFTSGYLWDGEQEENIRGWLEDHFNDIASLNCELSGSYDQFSAFDHMELAKSPSGLKLLQLYCRDATAEYIDMLANQLPEGITPFLLLDTTGIQDPVHLANLLSKEHFPHVSLALKGNAVPFTEMRWETPGTCNAYVGIKPPEVHDLHVAKTALCLPSVNFLKPSEYQEIREIFTRLSDQSELFRIIPEGMLISEWEELDYLIVSQKSLSPQGKRMLMGFCAAGGTVVTVGQPIGLPYEISLEEFLSELQ